MSIRFFQELHNTAPALERGMINRLPMKQYVHTLKARTQSMVNSYLQEFLEDVFSAEQSSRFFKHFMQRFVSDSNGASDDNSHFKAVPVFAFVPVAVNRPR